MSQRLKCRCRYEAKTIKEAKYVAKVWRYNALYESKIHIRRGHIVISTAKNLLEAFRFYCCAMQEREMLNNKQPQQ